MRITWACFSCKNVGQVEITPRERINTLRGRMVSAHDINPSCENPEFLILLGGRWVLLEDLQKAVKL